MNSKVQQKPAQIEERLLHAIGVREWGMPSLCVPGKIWRSEKNATISCMLAFPCDNDFQTCMNAQTAATLSHWLPIASAPKDGTNILATDGELVAIVWWDWEWRDHGTTGVMGKHDYAPTHWMHIPRLPN